MDDFSFDPWDKESRPEGADLLDKVEAFLGRFVAYPSDHAKTAHTLWIAHAHMMDLWESTPRIAFLSPEPGSGKSRALEVTEPLVPRPVHAVNATPAFLFRKVADPDGAPTVLYDEIDTVFGPRAKDNEDVRGMLNAGHRRGATAGRCVVKGKTVETEELEAYCAVALAGLNDLPDTIMTRSVIVRMRRRSPNERVEPWRLRLHRDEAQELHDALVEWSRDARIKMRWPEMPAGIEDRDADVWEALLAVADMAGRAWPQRARDAAVALVADAHASPPSLGIMLLTDLKAIFEDREKVSTEEILERLHEMDERPWGELRGKPVDSRWLSRQLTKYGVKSKQVRVDDRTLKGYKAEDLADPWSRYVSVSDVSDRGENVSDENARDNGSVSDVSHVSHSQGDAEAECFASNEPLWNTGDLVHTYKNSHSNGDSPQSHDKSETRETSETDIPPMPDAVVVDGPGRCPRCQCHVEAQGHDSKCDIDEWMAA